MKTRNLEVQQWWTSLPSGERRLLCALMRLLKSARRSQINDVARAAAKWESGLAFFIKIRLMHQRPPRASLRLKSSSSPSSSSSSSIPIPRGYPTKCFSNSGLIGH